MKLRASLGLVLLCLCPSMANADDSLYTARYATCMNNSGGVTVEMLNCIDEELVSQDARLNGAYKRLIGQLSPTRKKQLVVTQRLWIQYRDANCKFYADPEGGTAATVRANECVLTETAGRAKELEGSIE